MTEQEFATIVEAAHGREGKTAPAPWELFFNQQGRCEGVSARDGWSNVIDATDGHLFNTPPDDMKLILAAPQLQEALIHATDNITIYLARIAELEAELASCKSVDIPEVWVIQKNHGYSGYGTPERAFTSEKAAMQYAKAMRWWNCEITDVYLIHDVTNGEEPHGDES